MLRKQWPALLQPAAPLVELPELVRERYEACRSVCFCGVFASLQRVWATVDNSFFLWKLDRRDVPLEYSGESQAICAAGLVKPRQGVFIDAIQHLIVLATPVEIVLLGVCEDGKGDLSLQPLPLYTVPSDNVVMTAVASTSNGRLFLGGGDGNLYEILYSTGDGWREKRCRKICHTVGLGRFLPSFLKIRGQAAIVQLVADEHRGAIYARTSASAIQVYDIGPNCDQKPTYVDDCADVNSAGSRAYNGYDIFGRSSVSSRTGADKNANTLVSVLAVPPSESSYLHLLAVMADGRRLYFTTHVSRSYTSSTASKRRPSTLKAVVARAAPRLVPPTSAEALLTAPAPPLAVEYAYMASSAWLLAAAARGSAVSAESKLLLVARDYAGGSGFREAVGELRVLGHTTAVALLTSQEEDMLGNEGSTELSSQFYSSPTRFAVVTTAGVMQVLKPRPVDVLADILSELTSSGEDAKADEKLRSFFRNFGAIETAAMCHAITCASSSSSGRLLDGDVVKSARRVLEDPTLCGNAQTAAISSPPMGPASSLSTGQWASPSAPAMGEVVEAPQLSFTVAHDGLVLYASRLLRPFWRSNMFHPVSQTKHRESVLKLGASTVAMYRVEQELRALVITMSDNNLLIRNNGTALPVEAAETQGGAGKLSPGETYTNFPGKKRPAYLSPYESATDRRYRREEVTRRRKLDEVRSKEARSVAGLKLLLLRSAEILHLLCIFDVHHVTRLVLRLTAEERKSLLRMSFAELVVSSEGLLLMEKMTAALLDGQLVLSDSDGSGQVYGSGWMESLTSELRQFCPSFFGEKRRAFYLARELLRQARNSPDGSDARQRLVEDALSALLVSPPDTADDISAAVLDFEALGFWPGVVQLPVQCARAEEDIPQRTGKSAEFKASCYEVVADALRRLTKSPTSPGQGAAARRHLYQLVFKTHEDGLHNAIFEASLELGLEKELLPLAPSSLEAFLLQRGGSINESSTAVPLEATQVAALELLARLHVERGAFAAAAMVLLRLAERPPRAGEEIPLENRQRHLQNAALRAKSAISDEYMDEGAAEAASLLDLVEGKVQVLSFQKRLRDAFASVAAQGGDEVAEAQRRATILSGMPLDLSTLYNDYAYAAGMWQICLEMIHFASAGTGGNYADGDANVKALWDQLLLRELLGDGKFPGAAAITIRMGEKFFPDEAAFPVNHVVLRMETAASGLWPATPERESKPAIEEQKVPSVMLQACHGNAIRLARAYSSVLAPPVKRDLAEPRLRLQILKSTLFVSRKAASDAQSGGMGTGARVVFGDLLELCERCGAEARRLQVPADEADEAADGFASLRSEILSCTGN